MSIRRGPIKSSSVWNNGLQNEASIDPRKRYSNKKDLVNDQYIDPPTHSFFASFFRYR